MSRKLIFRLGEVGFVVDLDSVVEISEDIAGCFDATRSDLRLGIVGALAFRQTWIPVVDPTLGFDLPSEGPIEEKAALVLDSAEGNWALLVDRVEGIYAADRLRSCLVPPLLKLTAGRYYTCVELMNAEPLVVLDPSRFYGSTAI